MATTRRGGRATSTRTRTRGLPAVYERRARRRTTTTHAKDFPTQAAAVEHAYSQPDGERMFVYYKAGKFHLAVPGNEPEHATSVSVFRRPSASECACTTPAGGAGAAATAIGFDSYASRTGEAERLDASRRDALPDSSFALPARRQLPIEDPAHIRAAAARLSMMRNERHVTPAEYEQAHRRIQAAGRRHGIEVREEIAHEDRGVVWTQRPDGIFYGAGTGGTYYLVPTPSGEYRTMWVESGGDQRDLGTHSLAGSMQVVARHAPHMVAAEEARRADADGHERNAEGLTFTEWVHAANAFRRTPLSYADARRMWREGVDPTELGAKRHAANEPAGVGETASEARVWGVYDVKSRRWLHDFNRAPADMSPARLTRAEADRQVDQWTRLNPGERFEVRRIGEGAREDLPAGTCGPWSRVEKDVTKYRACMALADQIGSIDGHDSLHRFIRGQMEKEDVEVYYAIVLDTQMQPRGFAEIARGARDSVMTPVPDTVRFALHYAVSYGAMGLAIAHCHPSGKCRPSKADHEVTRAIQGACGAVQICWLDHIVVGLDEYYSFRARKSFKASATKKASA